ncbi:MAG: hypothetical protein PUB63_03495, partial [Clostridia bacterium]|nr:hypothetical protein [Clostridia bacterium]
VLRHFVPYKGLHALAPPRPTESCDFAGATCGYALRELVSAIYVDAPDKSGGKRVRHIRIKYDGLNFIPLNARMKEKTA